MTTIGLLTIGHAPRTDVTPDILAQLPDEVDVVEAGALDPFDSAAEVRGALGPHEGQPVFVTRLRDGSSVTVPQEPVFDLLQERVYELAEDATMIGVLCTGDFPPFDADVPVLEPSELLHAWATSIVDGGTIGVLTPKPEQITQATEKWADFEVVTAAGSPYTGADEVAAAATEIGTGTDLVVMDCIGYTPAMKAAVRERTGTGVLLSRSVLAKTTAEVL
ncbi:AroM family protein [Halomarina salina]|uniref:AroM family protein n=1 Tax=Halomarina salina TaxID=1872699 RepID=A0ABD5RRD8_9EURY|nr:AroM family protein [Halomarina salina]